GPVAVAALRMLHVDRLFLGVHGMDARAGLTTPNLVEAETNQALVQTARQVCVLADHSKWGTVGLSTIIPLASVDLLVTDPGLGPRAQQALTDAGVETVLAAPTTARAARTTRSQA
ncbi:MAG TPA: DeoR family transcriptional regulator, partial [Pedococcus sp.]|nr:DeoR family transcriptional regulator [Pedococcus sp.]